MPYYYCDDCDTTCWVKENDEIVCAECGKLLAKEEDESENDYN